MRRIFLYSICVLLVQPMFAQQDVDSILSKVERNNKSLRSNKNYWEAKQQSYKTGLTPYDPFVEYDYMFGTPVGAGNQRDFAVTQRFDFPSAYKRKKELSGSQVVQTQWQQQVFRRDVLLEAKLLTLHVIYLNKKATALEQRRAAIEKLVKDYELKMQKGEVIVLDYNKAKLQLLTIKNEVALNENEKAVVLTKLMELNGGTPVVITDTIYPLAPAIPSFDVLDSIIEANDPILQVYEQEKAIQQQEINLQKAMNLPKMETGYHSQGILGQSYKGFHVGITIPLWENKNKINAARSNLIYAASAADAHITEHRLQNKQYYELLDVRKQMMNEHKELLLSLNNTALLNKALAFGQITVIQYFYEESFYFTAYDQYLQAEREYYEAVAKLFKHEL
jgi:outer membrane protein, heavy metal efflux system